MVAANKFARQIEWLQRNYDNIDFIVFVTNNEMNLLHNQKVVIKIVNKYIRWCKNCNCCIGRVVADYITDYINILKV